jgi:hypothetical protein
MYRFPSLLLQFISSAAAACTHKILPSWMREREREGKLLTLFRSANHSRRTGGSALCTGADGPRAGAGRSAAWCEAAVLSGQTRTVRGTGPDGPRPGAGARIPCLTAGRSAP